MDEHQLKSLLTDIIRLWRTLFDELSPEQQQYKGKPFYFAPPLQMEVFRFFNRAFKVSVQLWVFSQFEDRPDGEVVCHNIETKVVQKEIPEILEDSRFDRYLSDSWRLTWLGESLTVRQAIAEACESALRMLRGDLSAVIWGSPRYGMRAGGSYPSEKLWTWAFQGDPTQDDINREVIDWIDNAKKPRPKEAPAETQPRTPRTEPRYDLLGSYLYPPAWVGGKPKPSVQQLLSSGIYGSDYLSEPFTRIVCEHVGDGLRMVATQEGLIAISSGDKRLFTDIFNIIVALLNLVDYEFLALRENELMYLEYFRNRQDEIHPSSYESNKARLSPWLYRDFLTPVVPTKSLQEAFQLSRYILQKEPLKGLFLIFAEASSHLFQGEHSQCVLWAWIFVERWVSLIWQRYLKDHNIPAKLRAAFGELDISRNLKILLKSEIIDSKLHRQLENFRGLRNQIAHQGIMATERQAQDAFDICKKLLSSITEAKTGFFPEAAK